MAEFNMNDKGTAGHMPPQQTLATALIYMCLADQKVSTDEIGEILSAVRTKIDGSSLALGEQGRELLDQAMAYAKTHPLELFLETTTPSLSDSQRMEILKTIIDVSLADGQPELSELEVFRRFLDAYGISAERFQPYFGRLHLDESTYLQ